MAINKKKETQYLCIFLDTFTTDSFTSSILDRDPRAIVIVYNHKVISIKKAPSNFPKLNIKVSFKNYTITRNIAPLFTFYQLMCMCFLIAYMRVKVNPKKIIVEGYLYGSLVALFIHLKIYKKMFYFSGDWLYKAKTKHFFSFIANSFVYKYLDYYANKKAARVINLTSLIQEKRGELWGEECITNNVHIPIPFVVHRNLEFHTVKKKNRVLFLGHIRVDSAIDKIVDAINTMQNKSILLTFIGRENEETLTIKKYCNKIGMKDNVEFYGYVEREGLAKIVDEAFCGFNLVSSKGSYTEFTIPAKTMDYIQYGIPVIVSANLGVIIEEIKRYRLGIVLDHITVDGIVSSLEYIYANINVYNGNFAQFKSKYKQLDFTDFLYEKI